jgi:hypothetical protein
MVSLYDHNPRSNCTSAEKGLEIQRQIVGDCIEQMYARSPKDQLHIQRYLSANCFGDYLTLIVSFDKNFPKGDPLLSCVTVGYR